MEISRHVTPAGLVMVLLIAGLLALVRVLQDSDNSGGSEAEARRVQERMKQYQDEWERDNPQAGSHNDDPRS